MTGRGKLEQRYPCSERHRADPLCRAVAYEEPSWASRLTAIAFCSRTPSPAGHDLRGKGVRNMEGPPGRHTAGSARHVQDGVRALPIPP